jgi:hypothetical protein
MGLTFGPMLTRRRFAAGAFAIAGTAALPAYPTPVSIGEDARLMQLFRTVAKAEDALDPLGLIYRGGLPNVASFRELYTDTQQRAKRSLVAQALAGLKRIDRRLLSP